MKTINRRLFLSQSTKVGVGVYLAGMSNRFFNPSTVSGANERVNFAVIGCGGRGRYVARGLIEQGARLSSICDLDEERMGNLQQFIQDVQKARPERFKDMRHIFDDKNIDAVAVVTPDHWHALPTVLACQAGKDVYVEKPHANCVWESQKMIEAAEKYKRVVQVGTQNRSAPYVLAARDYIQSGKLGKIGLVKVYNLKSGKSFFLGDAGKAPAGFDWDMWLGPAPDRPYHQKIFNHGWLYFWDYCNGDMSDDGIHQLDLAFLALGDPGMPRFASSTGGRFIYEDDAEVPDVQTATFTFTDLIMTFEMTNYPRYMQKTTATIRRNDEFPYWTQNATRVEIYGSELMMTIGRMGGGWQVMTSGGKVVEQMYGRPPDEYHYRNFIDCIKTRKKPNADIRIAHKAFTTIMLAVIAHKTGNRTVEFDKVQERFINDDHANKLLRRTFREKYRMPEDL